MEVATFGGRGATRWPRLLLALSCLSSASAFATDTALCAACYNSYRQLAGVLNKTKTDLELSKEANDKKAAKVDKVQKAQTKRWLKNEYGVALRAALEEEMEVLCSRDTMTATPALQSACSRFVEANEDDLPRMLLDEKPLDPFCASRVAGCEGPAVKEALEAHQRKAAKSEKAPKASAKLVRGAVTRLVGKTYTKFVRDTSEAHVLVLVHSKAASGSQPREASDMRYASLISEFYALAGGLLNGTAASEADKERFRFAQIDVSKNELPPNTPLSDAHGASVLLYGLGEAAHDPKSMPAMGEASLAHAKGAAVRSQLSQLLLTYLPKRDQPLISKLMSDRGKALEGGDASDAEAAPAAAKPASPSATPPTPATPTPATPTPPTPAPTPPRRKAPSVSKAALAQRQAQDCDACVLVMGELEKALNQTKDELELAAEANQKRADGVQKAQTKRWLKNEYKVALVAAVEERMEKVCTETDIFDVVCDMPPAERRVQWEALGARGSGVKECNAVAMERCKVLTDEQAELISRAALDAKGIASCAKIVRGCEPEELLGDDGDEDAEATAVESVPIVVKDEV